MATYLNRPRRTAAIAIAATLCTLAGCTIPTPNVASSQQPEFYKVWPTVHNGQFLCLAATPGTPIYQGTGRGAILGYTRDVVAFSYIQHGPWISVQTDQGLMGYIDGGTIRAYPRAHPGHSCTVQVDIQQHPIFYRFWRGMGSAA